MAIIHSWCPEITLDKIIMVNIKPFDDGAGDFEYKASDDHLELYYYSENNEVKHKWIQNVFK